MTIRKRLSSFFPLLLLFIGFATAGSSLNAESAEKTVAINAEKTWGVWDGWGASLAWWGKVFGDQEQLADLFFTTKPVEIDGKLRPGLGLNIVRYNAGACSWVEIDGRRMVVSNTILPFRQIEGYWLDGKNPDPTSDSWDWSVDANQRDMLLMAKERGADRFELFSNSPMWWMCLNDNPSGAAKATDNNISPNHYHNFAYYLATIARHAKDDWGIEFTTVSPFNEPSSKWWHQNGKQEGSHVSPEEQMKILPLVRAAFDAQGLQEIELVASDESYYDEAVTTWRTFTPEVKAIVDQVNVHGYQGDKGQRDVLYQIAHVEDGKRLWNSEHGDKDASGLDLARNMHRDFRWLRPTAWAYWQPIDGGLKGLGGSGWGLVDSRMLDGTNLKVNPKLYVLAQYSRHIKPGMVILDSGDDQTVTAYDPESRKLVIVSLNDSDKERVYHYDLSGFQSTGRFHAGWITEPEGESRYVPGAQAKLNGKHLTATFPPHSIQTCELNDVVLADSQ